METISFEGDSEKRDLCLILSSKEDRIVCIEFYKKIGLLEEKDVEKFLESTSIFKYISKKMFKNLINSMFDKNKIIFGLDVKRGICFKIETPLVFKKKKKEDK